MPKNFSRLVLLALLHATLILPFAQAQEPQAIAGTSERYTKFKNEYDNGRYQSALELLLEQPEYSQPYFYNLGNTYFQLQDYGRAYAFFQKARRMPPREHPDVVYNAKQAALAVLNTQSLRSLQPANDFLDKITQYFSGDLLHLCLSVLLLLWGLHLARGVFRRKKSIVKIAKQAETATGLVLVLGVAALTIAWHHQSTRDAGVLLEATPIFSGPGNQYQQLERFPSGVELVMTGRESNDWFQIRYARDAKGWVPKSSLLVLN